MRGSLLGPVSISNSPVSGGLRHRLAQLGVRVRELLVGLGGQLLGLLLGDEPLADQLLRVDLAHRRVLLDLVVHQRLRVRGLVGLVVAEAAVADQVDHRVAAELAPEPHRQPDRGDARLDVVGVHVDDGTSKPFARSDA